MVAGVAFALAAMLVADAQSGNGVEKLFACSDGEWSVELIGSDSGKLVLFTNKPKAKNTTGNATSSWEEVREGYVTGQVGGHQHHIRLYDGVRQIILFEGNNGKLTDNPGHIYAGAMTQTKTFPEQDFSIACEASELNLNIVENVRAWAKRTGATMPEPEEPGSEYDAWF